MQKFFWSKIYLLPLPLPITFIVIFLFMNNLTAGDPPPKTPLQNETCMFKKTLSLYFKTKREEKKGKNGWRQEF